jgi:hypothetical protein
MKEYPGKNDEEAKKAYREYIESDEPGVPLRYEEWYQRVWLIREAERQGEVRG